MTEETKDQRPAETTSVQESWRQKSYDQLETAPPVLANPAQAGPPAGAVVVSETTGAPVAQTPAVVEE